MEKEKEVSITGDKLVLTCAGVSLYSVGIWTILEKLVNSQTLPYWFSIPMAVIGVGMLILGAYKKKIDTKQ